MEKNIQEKILHFLKDRNWEESVWEVRIGLGYTAVQLESDNTGLAYTLRQDLQPGCSVFPGLRPLAGRKVGELLPLLRSEEKIEASVGLASVNALVNQDIPGTLPGDILDILIINPDDVIGMVGYFAPMVPALQKRVRHLHIFEKLEKPGVILPEEAAYDLLPKCQIALITSTTIINKTIDPLLKAAASCREVVLLGPSTPLAGEAFQDTPVTLLSGIEITDPKKLLQVVSEGGGARDIRNLTQKINLKI
jgi:uncharacterized protein